MSTNPPEPSERDAAREHWDSEAVARQTGGHVGWLDSPLVLQELVQPRTTGDPRGNWLSALTSRIELRRDLAWLSLGCGAAHQEVQAAKDKLFASMEAIDLSPASLGVAREVAAAAGVENIRFAEGNLNQIVLSEAKFDVVLMNMSLHHVEAIERLMKEIDRTLRPGGWILVNEYVGPRQFQFTDTQLRLVARLLEALPERLRLDSTTGDVKREYVRRPVSWWRIADPSEAIRSDRILPEIESRFDVLDRRDYGGAILHLLLEHIVQNFSEGNPEDAHWIRMLGAVEATLEEAGLIRSDFVQLAARRRQAERPPGRSSRWWANRSRSTRR